MVFNTGIALVLMEMNVFSALGHVLGLYSNVAIAWMMAVVADLVVNKPMGWSPRASSSSARTCTTSTRWASARWASPRCCRWWRTSAPSARWRRPSRR
jgi:hypothetical protein